VSANRVAELCVSSLREGLAVLFIAVLLSPVVIAQDLPKAWRRATAIERARAWRRKSSTRFFRVEGDFDGDGKPDVAELLINDSTKKFALFVRLASEPTWQRVSEQMDVASLDRFAIDLVKPGRYETACGKGYDDSFCAHGEPDYLVLSHPAIDFIYTESADNIFYWDEKTKSFREIAMSD
jgi:hypothetical protein